MAVGEVDATNGVAGEIKLVAALLADAIGLAAHGLRRRESDLPPTPDQAEAWAFLFDPDAVCEPWDFATCAAMLGRDPAGLRRALRERVVLQAKARSPRPRVNGGASGGRARWAAPTGRVPLRFATEAQRRHVVAMRVGRRA